MIMYIRARPSQLHHQRTEKFTARPLSVAVPALADGPLEDQPPNGFLSKCQKFDKHVTKSDTALVCLAR